ncbi:MAG: hypothetical protein LQ350_000835, partial [Teloschistes chrysophthalmus]
MSSQQPPKIAFAGLGAMGFGMASHLLTSSFPVTGYDIFPPALDRFLKESSNSAASTAAKTPLEAAQDADFLICMVATSAQADPLLFDPTTGAVQGLKLNATIIICSTVSPAYITSIQTRLTSLNRSDIRLLDCPVSGGAARAAAGTLSIFSSGHPQHLQHARPVLECLSARGKLYEVRGGLGMGSKAKLIHQVFAGVHIAMASEAMGLAAVAGMETRGVYEVVVGGGGGGGGGSWMFENRVVPMLERGHKPYSAVEIIAKDVGIITSTSREYKHPLPLLSTAEQLYLTSISAGLAKEDDCVTVRLYIPAHPTLVADRASPPTSSPNPTTTTTTTTTKTLPEPISNDVTIETIRDLLIAVHLAAASEAMAFCDRLRLDADLMYDIVTNAAGASEAFVKNFEALRKGGWELKAVPDAEGVRDRL